MKAVLYARVSTTEEAEMQNPETQLIILRDYCKAMDYEIIEEFVDHKSGKDPIRPDFQRMMAEATKKRQFRRFDAIVCLRLDRFMRSAYFGLEAVHELEDSKCGLIFVRDHVDTTSPMGKFFFTIMSAFAELERKQTGKRVSEGINRHIREGGKWGHRKINPDLLAEYVRQHPTATKSEIARTFGVSRATVNNNLRMLEGCKLSTPSPGAGSLNTPQDGSSDISTNRDSDERGRSNEQ